MKKCYFLLAAITVSLLTSCKKEYSCTCVTTDNGTITSSVNVKYTTNKRIVAEAACNTNQSFTSGSSTMSTTCKLD